MKNSVILTLAALLLCSCSKDETVIPNPSTYDGYMWVDNEKFPLEILHDTHFIVFKRNDEQTVLQQLKEKGCAIVNSTYMMFTSHLYEYHPESLKDCLCTNVKGVGNLREIPQLVYNTHLYRAPQTIHPYKERGASNGFYVGVNSEEDLDMVEEYARRVNAFVIRESYKLRGVLVVCTNASAGTHVQLANWFYETGKFRYAEPEMQDINWY